MTQLQTLQSKFQSALLDDQPSAPGLLNTRSVVQFDVYRHAYRARLRGALRDNFEVLPLVMGDDAFDALANAYINNHPSRHYSLRWFGHALGTFMAEQVALVDHPAMTDLARMEWALRTAFDAAPATLLTPAELTAVPAQEWAQLVFALQPSVQLLNLQWAVGPVWHALKSGADEIPPPEALDHHMLVWRQGMNTQWKSLTPTETIFVQCLLARKSFGAVCMALSKHAGEETAASTAVQLISHMLADETLCTLAPSTLQPPGSIN